MMMITNEEDPTTSSTPATKEETTTPDRLIIDAPTPTSRFRLWYALTVFSAVSLIALSTETQEWRVEEKWALSVTLLSLVLSSLASLAHIGFREKFVGMPIEGLVLFTESGFWLGGHIVMMDFTNMLAVDANGRILNPNLYFFSWASLITTAALFIGYGQQVHAPNAASNYACNAGSWAWICIASLVVMVSSLQIFVQGVTLEDQEFVCQDGDSSGFCQRLKFSIALGVISLCFAGACSRFSCKMPPSVDASASFLMLFAWAFGVAFVTFGDKSPGNEVGNLYFSCWAAFTLSLFMVSTSIKNFLTSREKASNGESGSKAMILSEPSSDTEKAEKPGDEAETSTQSEVPMTPTSITVMKDGQPSLEVDEMADPAAPVQNVEIPAAEV